MKKYISFTAYITLLVLDDSDIIKDYDDTNDLVDDIVSYKFSPVLPAINSGAVIIDNIDYEDIEEAIYANEEEG